MSQLQQYQPFGTSINPFGSDFLDRLNAMGEAVGRLTAIEEPINRIVRLAVDEQDPGEGGGVAIVGKVASAVPGPYSDPPYNFNYTVELKDGTVLPAMEPWDRRFDPAQVDHERLGIGDQVTLFPLPPNPFTVPVVPDGACLQANGDCVLANAFTCGGGTFMGAGVPCANLYAAEYVKISVCPAPLPAMQGPPPIITTNAGLLS